MDAAIPAQQLEPIRQTILQVEGVKVQIVILCTFHYDRHSTLLYNDMVFFSIISLSVIRKHPLMFFLNNC